MKERITLFRDRRVVKHFREAEIDDFNVEVRVEHYVLEFDIAMNDTAGMKVVDSEDLSLMRGGNRRSKVKYERVEPYKIAQPQNPKYLHNAPSNYAYHPLANASTQLLALVDETTDTRKTHQSKQSLTIHHLEVYQLDSPS